MNIRSLLCPLAALAALLAPAALAASDPAPVEAEIASGPALWEVRDEDTTIYLFGTVHVLPADTQWLDERIKRAFTAADEVVFEVEVGDAAAMQQAILQKAALPGNETLRSLMTAENRAQFEAALSNFGLPQATFDRSEPWMAAMTLSVLPLATAGYASELGVEMSLNALAAGKRKGALETIEEQIGLFDTLPLDTQLAYLDDTVESMSETADSVQQMITRWLAGDPAGLAVLMNADMRDPELYRRLLTDRNARWAEWVERRLAEPGIVFVAVGAGHLAGSDSVQAALAARGLHVSRVWH